MNYTTIDDIEEELKSYEEKVVASLKATEDAKEELKVLRAKLRKDRIASVSKKLLAPYRKFRIYTAMAKRDLMIKALEKKQELDEKRLDFLQALEDKKDDVVSFANDTKDNVIDFGKEIGSEVSDTFSYIREMGASRVSMTASFVVSVKNTTIKKVKENTTIDLIIRNAIEDAKLKYATDKYNKALDKMAKKEEQERREKLNADMKLDEVVREDYKERNVPFSNINEKIQKASRQSSYMGKATNRVVKYFKSKKDDVITAINNKILDVGIAVDLNALATINKVSMAKSKISTTFNNKLDKIKEKADNVIGDTIVNAQDTMDSINSSLNRFKGNIHQAIEDRKDRSDRKKDMVAALREQDEREIAIKKARLDSMREALNTVNNIGDVFSNAPSLEVGRTK